MKHKLFLFAVLMMALAIPQSVKAYDFGKAYQGQMLYYTVIDSVNHYVMLTCPKDTLLTNGGWDGNSSLWDNNNRPSGALVLPDTVSHNGITYTVRAIGNNTFSNCLLFTVVMPNTVDSLGDYAFDNCNYLSNMTFSNTLSYIGKCAYSNTNLGDVVLPASVRIIGESAFANANITNITLNDSVQYLGFGCLQSNPLISLFIPASVYYFNPGNWGMSGALASIVVDPDNPYFDSRENCNAIINSNNELILGCKNTIIPYGVEKIVDFAFSNHSLETLNIPSSVQFITLYGCHVNRLVINSQIAIIDWNSFGGIDTIHIPNMTPPFVTVSQYTNYAKPIIVPCNSIPAFQSADHWSDFTNYIEDGMQKVTAQQSEHGSVTVAKPTCANPSATFTATADEGYHFAQWSDGNTNNPRTVIVDSDTTLTVIFAINQYTVNAITNDLEMGNVTGSGIRNHGSTITLTATANSRYHFDHWSDNVTDNPRPLTVTRDTTVTAYFVALPVDTLYIHDTTIITDTVIFRYYMYDTTIVNNYQYDTSIYNHFQYDTTLVFDTIIINIYNFDTSIYNTYQYDTIIVNNYYFDTVFVTNYYHDTIIVNNYIFDTIYLNRYIFDTIYIHDTVFVPSGQDGIDEVDAINAKIYQRDGQIVVEGAENNTVWLYDVNGRVLAIKRDEYAPLHFDVPVSGTYMIKIGNHPARRVVVIR